MRKSFFGERFGGETGISVLMEDLGRALRTGGGDVCMLGGGNPVSIPAVRAVVREVVEGLIGSGRLEKCLGCYDPPAGNVEFREELAGYLRQRYGWQVGAENIALTNGSQTAFFLLFNMLAGRGADGCRKILLPLCPEYIGYADVGLEEGLFATCRPRVEYLDGRQFKYHIDFENLPLNGAIGAICVSRPTNPSGNVLTDYEVERLAGLARRQRAPLILDSAYGLPFPGIVFGQARPYWGPGTIVCMSLSKLGLPMVRTGIVVADAEVVEALARANAIMSLAPGGMGAVIGTELLRRGLMEELSEGVIGPFYQEKARRALEMTAEAFEGLEYRVHRPEGAFFLWLWFPGLRGGTQQLYERLKDRGVLVVPGHYFWPGLAETFGQVNECLRVHHAQEESVVRRGLEEIAAAVRPCSG